VPGVPVATQQTRPAITLSVAQKIGLLYTHYTQFFFNICMQNFENMLKGIGLLPSEAKVYLASLALGPSSVQNIAKKSELSRTAAYEAVETLEKRGLMKKSTQGKTGLYAAEDPEKIITFLNSEQQRFQVLMGDFARSLDAIRLLAGGTRPIVRVYEGEEAMSAYYEHIFETVKAKNFSEITNFDDFYALVDTKAVVVARKTYKHFPENLRVLHVGQPRLPRPGVQLRRLNDKWSNFHGSISIYDNNVALETYIGKPTVVIIESEVLAKTMQTIFDMAWEHSEKPEENVQ
jgi:HTH-type transcriptional regulator, sugar sensing transcriptional regulator